MAFNIDKIKELYPEAEDKMIQPMLIHASTQTQLQAAEKSGQYFGQLKKDGALYMAVFTNNYQYLFGRTISKVTGLLTEKGKNVPHIMDTLKEVLPPNTILLGEIYYPGKKSNSVTTIMGCLPEKAIERQKEQGLIKYYIYDVLMYNGVNLIDEQVGNYARYKIVQKIFEKFNLTQYDFLELAEVWENNLLDKINEALAAGEEGMVLKLKSGLYMPGKRPMYNLKAKKSDSIDAFIIDFEDATMEYTGKELPTWNYWLYGESIECEGAKGHYWHKVEGYFYENYKNGENYKPITKPYFNGWKTAIKIGCYDNNGKIISIGTISSGLTDELREAFNKNPAEYAGRVVEINCMEKDNKSKTLRHGYFKGFRDDKTREECTVNTIFN